MSDKMYAYIGNYFKKLRIQRDLSLDEASSRMKIKRSTLYSWETADRQISTDNIMKLCDFYSISIDVAFDEFAKNR